MRIRLLFSNYIYKDSRQFIISIPQDLNHISDLVDYIIQKFSIENESDDIRLNIEGFSLLHNELIQNLIRDNDQIEVYIKESNNLKRLQQTVLSEEEDLQKKIKVNQIQKPTTNQQKDVKPKLENQFALQKKEPKQSKIKIEKEKNSSYDECENESEPMIDSDSSSSSSIICKVPLKKQIPVTKVQPKAIKPIKQQIPESKIKNEQKQSDTIPKTQIMPPKISNKKIENTKDQQKQIEKKKQKPIIESSSDSSSSSEDEKHLENKSKTQFSQQNKQNLAQQKQNQQLKLPQKNQQELPKKDQKQSEFKNIEKLNKVEQKMEIETETEKLIAKQIDQKQIPKNEQQDQQQLQSKGKVFQEQKEMWLKKWQKGIKQSEAKNQTEKNQQDNKNNIGKEENDKEFADTLRQNYKQTQESQEDTQYKPTEQTAFKLEANFLMQYFKDNSVSFLKPKDYISFRTLKLNEELMRPEVSNWKKGKIQQVTQQNIMIRPYNESQTLRINDYEFGEIWIDKKCLEVERYSQLKKKQEQTQTSNTKPTSNELDTNSTTKQQISDQQNTTQNQIQLLQSTPQPQTEVEKPNLNKLVSEYSKEGFIARQTDYYFSEHNYPKDKYIMQHTKNNEGSYMELRLMLNFPKIKNILKDDFKYYQEIIKVYVTNNLNKNFDVNDDFTLIRKKNLSSQDGNNTKIPAMVQSSIVESTLNTVQTNSSNDQPQSIQSVALAQSQVIPTNQDQQKDETITCVSTTNNKNNTDKIEPQMQLKQENNQQQLSNPNQVEKKDDEQQKLQEIKIELLQKLEQTSQKK